MPKKTTAKTQKITSDTYVPIFTQMVGLIGDDGQLIVDNKAFAHRSPSGREHVNQPFDVGAYNVQRPAEADPKTWEKIFEVCDNWYWKNGLV